MLSLTKANDILDFFLFFIGLFIPFLGDIFESIIGGIFDLLLFYWLLKDKDIGFHALWIFAIEMIDLTDFLTMGYVDTFGWIELFPLWYIMFIVLKTQAKQDEVGEESTISHESDKAKEKIEMQLSCPYCGEIINEDITVCESCGTIFKEK